MQRRPYHAPVVRLLSANCYNPRTNKSPTVSNYRLVSRCLADRSTAVKSHPLPHSLPSATVISVAIKTFTLPASLTKHVTGCHGYRSLSLKLLGKNAAGRCTHITSLFSAGPLAALLPAQSKPANILSKRYDVATLTLTYVGYSLYSEHN